jgi:hypothetical protein
MKHHRKQDISSCTLAKQHTNLCITVLVAAEGILINEHPHENSPGVLSIHGITKLMLELIKHGQSSLLPFHE